MIKIEDAFQDTVTFRKEIFKYELWLENFEIQVKQLVKLIKESQDLSLGLLYLLCL